MSFSFCGSLFCTVTESCANYLTVYIMVHLCSEVKLLKSQVCAYSSGSCDQFHVINNNIDQLFGLINDGPLFLSTGCQGVYCKFDPVNQRQQLF